ncbi:MAG: circularly permuted type 2 ATP-grasp protein [Pelovirga sp.]
MISEPETSISTAAATDIYRAIVEAAGAGDFPEHWQRLQQNLEKLGPRVHTRFREAQRLLRENGAIHNVFDQSNSNRAWQFDPLPLIFSVAEWGQLDQAMIQRAELFNLILQDIYGPRKLIEKRLLPPELVFPHSGFFYPCADGNFPQPQQLNLFSTTIAKGTDGNFWVVDDHVSPPFGAGYALETRVIMTRSFPQLFEGFRVHRLAQFFRAVRQRFGQLARQHQEYPRIVVLTAGPTHPDYFEHAYLASYLGYPLVQGGDLVVRDSCVWLKTVDGLHQVDVIFSRLADHACDPLELRSHSGGGVPGLLQAVRRGNLALVNPIGSSILANPALMAFLPGICRYFLGTDLKVPSIATWWCGQPRECKYVLENLDRLIIKPIQPLPDMPQSTPGRMTDAQRQRWTALISANPRLFVGQEQVDYVAFPAYEQKQLATRQSLVSLYVTAHNESYQLMPGGLSRVAAAGDNLLVSGQRAGSIKDTWVLTQEPHQQVNLWLRSTSDVPLSPYFVSLPSRAAENLFWAGRYAERTEQTARLLRSILVKLREVKEFGDPDDRISLNHLLQALTHVTLTYPGFVGKDAQQKLDDPRAELLSLIRDIDRSGSLRSSLRSLGRSAVEIRDLLPEDAWRLVDQMQSWNPRVGRALIGSGRMYENVHQLVLQLSAFSGLAYENMARETAWLLLNIGRRLERALNLIDLLNETLVPCYDSATEARIMETVLASCNSLVVFRRRYRSFMQLSPILELLLLDENYPRSLACQMRQMKRHISELPHEANVPTVGQDEEIISSALEQLQATDHKGLTRQISESGSYPLLEALLTDQKKRLQQLSNCLTQFYFRPTQALQQFGLPLREMVL